MTSQTEPRTLDPDAIGRKLNVMGVDTFFHDAGEGPPLLLLHGSGPGVSAWSNWRPVYAALSEHYRVIAPDQIGFNRTQPTARSTTAASSGPTMRWRSSTSSGSSAAA